MFCLENKSVCKGGFVFVMITEIFWRIFWLDNWRSLIVVEENFCYVFLCTGSPPLTRFSNNTVFCLHCCFSKVSKNRVSRGPPVQLYYYSFHENFESLTEKNKEAAGTFCFEIRNPRKQTENSHGMITLKIDGKPMEVMITIRLLLKKIILKYRQSSTYAFFWDWQNRLSRKLCC